MSFVFISDFIGMYDNNWEPSRKSNREWEPVPATIGPWKRHNST